MTAVLLDSVALIWWFTGNARFSGSVRKIIEDRSAGVYISAASVWEIATKVRAGKLNDAVALIAFVDEYIIEQEFVPLPITVAHAKLGGSLASSHKDPFDRLIAAQAKIEDLPVVTCDPSFSMLGVTVLW